MLGSDSFIYKISIISSALVMIWLLKEVYILKNKIDCVYCFSLIGSSFMYKAITVQLHGNFFVGSGQQK